jgi:hypothetical protein
MKSNKDFPRELGGFKPEGEKTITNTSSKFAAPVALRGRFYGIVFARVSEFCFLT